MVAEFLRKLRNNSRQPNQLPNWFTRDRPIVAISLIFPLLLPEVDRERPLHANIGASAFAPVAQRIEHLPCWSLNEEWN